VSVTIKFTYNRDYRSIFESLVGTRLLARRQRRRGTRVPQSRSRPAPRAAPAAPRVPQRPAASRAPIPELGVSGLHPPRVALTQARTPETARGGAGSPRRGRRRVVRGRPAAAGCRPHDATHHRLSPPPNFFPEQMPEAFAEEPSGWRGRAAEISVRAPTEQRGRRTRICDLPRRDQGPHRIARTRKGLTSRRFLFGCLNWFNDWRSLFPAPLTPTEKG
jgi:hypothetical protein